MTVTPSRRPPLKTDDVRRLIQSLDGVSDAVSLLALDGYKEVALAVGHTLPAPVTREFTATDEEWEAAAKDRGPVPEAVQKALDASPITNWEPEPAPALIPTKAATCQHEVWLIRKGTTEFYCPDCGTQKKEPTQG